MTTMTINAMTTDELFAALPHYAFFNNSFDSDRLKVSPEIFEASYYQFLFEGLLIGTRTETETKITVETADGVEEKTETKVSLRCDFTDKGEAMLLKWHIDQLSPLAEEVLTRAQRKNSSAWFPDNKVLGPKHLFPIISASLTDIRGAYQELYNCRFFQIDGNQYSLTDSGNQARDILTAAMAI